MILREHRPYISMTIKGELAKKISEGISDALFNRLKDKVREEMDDKIMVHIYVQLRYQRGNELK